MHLGVEKRKHFRVLTTKEWLLGVQIAIDDNIYITEIKDVSLSGIRCFLADEVPLTGTYNLRFILPKKNDLGESFTKIDVEAEIVRCEKRDLNPEIYPEGYFDIGFKFKALTQENLELVKTYIQEFHSQER